MSVRRNSWILGALIIAALAAPPRAEAQAAPLGSNEYLEQLYSDCAVLGLTERECTLLALNELCTPEALEHDLGTSIACTIMALVLAFDAIGPAAESKFQSVADSISNVGSGDPE